MSARGAVAVIGTTISMGLAVYALVQQDWRILAAGIVQGYVWAWVTLCVGTIQGS